jgi:hypothetical protein
MIIFFLTRSDPEDEYDLELPEDVYGETYSTLVVSLHKWSTIGVSLGLLCEMFTSVLHLVMQYGGVYMLVLAIGNTLAGFEADTKERESIATKFRDPVLWQAQNWNLYPENEWKRESMVWFCHDMISGPKGQHGYKGKAGHVNQLTIQYFVFQWVVLLVWLANIMIELRAIWHLKHLIVDIPSVQSYSDIIGEGGIEGGQADDPEGEDRETQGGDGETKVEGLPLSLKLLLIIIILIPKFYITCLLCSAGVTFLLGNDLEDDMQNMLLNTIGLVFVLEFHSLIYAAFASQQKKQQLSSLTFPSYVDKGVMRVITRYGDVPRLAALVAATTILMLNMSLDKNSILTPRDAGTIEGCCNFMQYLKGAGIKTPLAAANPCTKFRLTYESNLGVDVTGAIMPPGDKPEEGGMTAAGVALMQMSHIIEKATQMNHLRRAG